MVPSGTERVETMFALPTLVVVLLESGFVSGQIRCGLGIGKIKVEKCPSTAYTRCQNDSRSMKYECALGDGPLGCSTDEQGKKTICSCDTDLCNIGPQMECMVGKGPAAKTQLCLPEVSQCRRAVINGDADNADYYCGNSEVSPLGCTESKQAFGMHENCICNGPLCNSGNMTRSFSAGGTQSEEFQSQALLNGDPDGSGGDNGGYSGVKSNKSFTSLAVTVLYILSSKSQLLSFG